MIYENYVLIQVESSDGNPFWIIKPTALMKLSISHPKTATNLLRYYCLSIFWYIGFSLSVCPQSVEGWGMCVIILIIYY